MPTLFAIDTAGDQCSLALVHPGGLARAHGAPGHTHLEHVMPLVEALFADQRLAPAACDAFAFGNGPGSFTGLRVACTIVQGLAFGTHRPVIAVGNLAALAEQARTGAVAQPPAQRVLAAIDARMGQAYAAVYARDGDIWTPLLAPCLVASGELAALAARWRPDVCVGKAHWLSPLLSPGAGAGPGSADPGSAAAAAPWPLHDATVDAAGVMALARVQFARGAVLAPERAAPLYVRDDVARTVAQRRAALATGTA